MPARLERDAAGLLAFAAMLEGCGYYGCKDDLKDEYVPDGLTNVWRDSQTLELNFGEPLRPPSEVDPRRFALLRYAVKFEGADYYSCRFEVCYRQLDAVEVIPESLEWDPAEPTALRLHFAEPIPPTACEPWKGQHANYQALELIYLGVDPRSSFGSDTGGPEDVEPGLDQLAYLDDEGVRAFGPEEGRAWLEGCFAGGSCSLDELCVSHGGYNEDYDRRWRVDVRVECP